MFPWPLPLHHLLLSLLTSSQGSSSKVYTLRRIHLDKSITEDLQDESLLVLKLLQHAPPWEFYVSRSLQQRLPEDARSSFLNFRHALLYPSCSLLLSDLRSEVSLQDVINAYRKVRIAPSPSFPLFSSLLPSSPAPSLLYFSSPSLLTHLSAS